MSETVVIKELENHTIINNEESPDTLIVTGPASPSETVVVVEAAPSTTIVEQAHPVTIMISHGGSAYIDAVNQGFEGTEVDWLNHILNSKAEVSYVDGLLLQEVSDRDTAINNLAAQIAQDFATKLELDNVSSDINTQITAYDNQLKQFLNQYSTIQFVETEFDDRFGYMVQRIDTLEGSLGSNAAIIQKINEIVLTESEARASELTALEARVGLSYATKNELSIVESNADQARAALEMSLAATFNNRITAEMTSIDQAIANETEARTTSYQQLQANFNNVSVQVDDLDFALSTESQQRAQAIQSLNAELTGYQQAQTTLYQEIDSRIDGNTSAIAGFRTAITGDPEATQTQAEVGLESIKDQAGEAHSRAYLTVSTTVNGVTTVTGITADSINNMLAFSAGALSLRDSLGNLRLFWVEATDTWTFSGKLVLGDGTPINNTGDIQTLIGPRHYIKSLNGTAIRNNTGSITVEARTVTGTTDALSTGYLRAADNPSVNLGNTHTFTAAEITDSLLVEMVVGGVVRDTITLVDITDGVDGEDGTNGSDAIVGFVEADRISWIQDSGGIWPASTVNTVTAYFYQNGVEIAKQTVTLTLQTASGFINHTLGTGNNVNVSVLGSGTNEVTLKFTHTPSGIQVVETFFSVTKGADGVDGVDGVDGTDGNSVAIVYAADAAGNDQSYNQSNRTYVQYYEYVGALPTLPVTGTFVRFIGEDGQPANSIWAIYATSEAGANQSYSPIGKSWVTFYESVEEPTLPVTATFVKYIGEDGVNGIDGTDGMSVLVIYADDAAGNNQSLVAGSRRFINYYEYTGAQPTLPVSASFVEFIGTDGTPGQGVWPVYASDSNGSNQSFDPAGKTWVTFYESTTQPVLPVTAVFVKYVGEDGAEGPEGPAGTDGSDGYNTATLYAYKRAAAAPTNNPGTITYTFSTKNWTPANGWQKTVPANDGNPLWVVVATAVSQNNSDSVAGSEWSAPVEMAANGADGQDGADGLDGLNTAVVYLYKRTASSAIPSKPTGTLTYTFATGGITGSAGNGWLPTLPTTGDKYLWVCQATAANTTASDTIVGSEFSTAAILTVHGDPGPQGVPGTNGVDGTDGKSVAVIYAIDAAGTDQSFTQGSRKYVNYYEYTTTLPTLPVTATFVRFIGEDGQSANSIWPIYADDSAGLNQSFDNTNKKWVTFYESLTEPTLPVTATFVRYVGNDGPQGVPGTDGVDGQDGATYYTWIRYADDASGTNISNDPTGKMYIGLAYNKTTATESNNPLDYTWTKFVGVDGTDGIPGQDGEDGQTTYTWIAYSDNADGSGMYQIPTNNTAYIGLATNKLTATESTDPADYIWSRFRGEDGAPGQPGTDGTDGLSVAIIYAADSSGTDQSYTQGARTYVAYYEHTGTKPTLPVTTTFVKFIGEDGQPAQSVWPVYADDSNGSNQSFSSVGKDWVTFYESVVQPTLPVTGTFVRYIGTDGVTYYTWIRYADDIIGTGISNDPTGKTYIGFAYNKTTPVESNTASDYTWSLIKGTDGVPGEPGEDGITYYTWIAYSDNANGVPMYQTPTANTKYIGIAVNKTTATESTDPYDYVWSKFRGEDGTDGVPGEPGEDGVTYYTWIRYAVGATGSGISNDPTGKSYMGLAYQKTSPVESNDPRDYTWSRFRGEDGTDGVPGAPGADGQTTYTWIAYSDNANGNPMYQVPTSTTMYIGIAVNKTTATESSNPADYVWSLFRGADGKDGKDGEDGEDGTNGQPGAGMFGQTYSSISWTTATANSRFTALVGRAPVPLDVFVQTRIDGTDSQARQYNGSSWVSPALMLHGSMIATGTVAGDVLIAGTSINSPKILGGEIGIGGTYKDNFIVDSSGHITQAGGYYRTAPDTSPQPRVLIDGRPWAGGGTTAGRYAVWIGTGTTTAGDPLFYIDKAGNGFLKGEFLQGELLENKVNIENTTSINTATVTAVHSSKGKPKDITVKFNLRFRVSATPGNPLVLNAPVTRTLQLKKGATVLDTITVTAGPNHHDTELNYALYSVSGEIDYLDTSTTAGNITYSAVHSGVSGPPGVYSEIRNSTSIKTFENKMG